MKVWDFILVITAYSILFSFSSFGALKLGLGFFLFLQPFLYIYFGILLYAILFFWKAKSEDKPKNGRPSNKR